MTDLSVSGRTRLRIERDLPAPPDVVFARWIDPGSMAWLSPTGAAEVAADVRVGGRFTVVMLGDGMHLEHNGQYLAIDPPRRLSFTWVSPYTGPEPSVVTVDLAPEGDGTRLVLTHERLPEEQVRSHERGWGLILDNFTAVLATGDDSEEVTT